MALTGKISGTTGLNLKIAGDDGASYAFSATDINGFSTLDLRMGLKVKFDKSASAGRAAKVRLLDAPDTSAAVTVKIDSIKATKFHYGGSSYSDGVEVFYTYRIKSGWKNRDMVVQAVDMGSDIEDAKAPEPGHTDLGGSPVVSVFHPESGVDSRINDGPDPVCDGETHSVKATVGFGKYESVKVGAKVSVLVVLRVENVKSNEWAEARDKKELPLTETSTTPHVSQAKDSGLTGRDTSTGDWARTKPASNSNI